MATKTTNKLKKRIQEDKNFIPDVQKGLRKEVDTMKSEGLSRDAINKALRDRLTKSIGAEGITTLTEGVKQKSSPVGPEPKLFSEKGVVEDKKTPTIGPTVTEDIIKTPVDTQTQTLRDRVTQQVAQRKTREEALIEAREEGGRGDLVAQQQAFGQEARNVLEDIENITKGLEAEGGAITNIAASRIREARSAPLRETLASLVKGQELTAESIKQLDSSLEGILEARRLDREDQTNRLASEIEASNLSDAEKQELIGKLQVQTAQSQQRDELEIFRQKEQIKADIEAQEKESIASTGLTLDQNITLGKIINNFDVKEDSLVAKTVGSLIKEGKTEQEINKILGLATDSQGNFVDDTQFARREKLRKEFEGKAGVKTYREAVLQHQGTISTLGQASGPGDVAAVFQFMKTLDPTSVVRESEFDAAANAAGVLEKVNAGNIYEKFKNGAILGEKDSATREAFVKTVNELFKVKKDNYDGLARQMINQALRDGVDPRSVVLDLDEVPGASNLTRDSFTNLADDDIIEIDNEFGFTTSDGGSFNIDFGEGFNSGDQTSTTKEGLESFIKSKEGFRSEAYLDSAGVPTIGYGATSIDGRSVQMGDTFSKEKAEQIFNDDIARHSNFKELVTIDLTPEQQTALASFEFNLGPNIWKSTGKDIIDAINKGDFEEAGRIMLLHNKARNPDTGKLQTLKGLQNRREEEVELLKMFS